MKSIKKMITCTSISSKRAQIQYFIIRIKCGGKCTKGKLAPGQRRFLGPNMVKLPGSTKLRMGQPMLVAIKASNTTYLV